VEGREAEMRGGGPIGCSCGELGGGGRGFEVAERGEGGAEHGLGNLNQRVGTKTRGAGRWGEVCIGRLGESSTGGHGEASLQGNADANAVDTTATIDIKGKGREGSTNRAKVNKKTDAEVTPHDEALNVEAHNNETTASNSEGSGNAEHWAGYSTNAHAYGGHHSSITEALKKQRRGEYPSLNR
jgi:hypothetical protein